MDFWTIYTFDGGHDGLLPARWIARVYGLEYAYVHGKTQEEAVEKIKALMKEKDPNALWFQNLPVVQYR